jgi:serine/threonine protein kinase
MFMTDSRRVTGALPDSATPPPPPAQDSLLDQLRAATLGVYEVYGELGRGGMATVYLAHEISLARKVAIKVMSPALVHGPGMSERFKREARTAAHLSHPNIIPVYAVREAEGLLFFVMKLVEGTPLDAIMREVGKLPLPMVEAILAQVGGAFGSCTAISSPATS